MTPATPSVASARRAAAIASRAGRRVRDDLREQRVVVDADLAAALDAAVVRARPGTPPAPSSATRPVAGRKSLAGILGVEARLDGVAGERELLLRERQRLRPAATRICQRTRSSPVTISVTGCSTWRRVLTSRK